MRVLVVSQYFWPENFGINALVQALHERGVDVTVLTGKPNYPDGRIFDGFRAWGTASDRYGEIDVIRLPLFPRGKNSSWRLALNYLSFIVAGLLLAPWLLRRRTFDMVFVYAPSPLLQAIPAVLISKLRRVPLAVWVQDLWPESLSATGFVRNRAVLAMVKTAVRFIYRACDAILIQSEAFREPVAQLSDRADKIIYYPNSVQPQTASTTTSDRALTLVNDLQRDFCVVFAGNLGAAQSLETIVDAAQQLLEQEDIRIVLVGSGSRDAWLAAEIAERGLTNLVLVGRLPPQDMPAIFKAASALLVTLKDEPIFSYTIPSKLQAYLASGRPIIAAINGEGARIVREAGAGFALPAGDSVALAKVIRSLHEMDSQTRAMLGARGIDYFRRNFDQEKLAADLIQHFEKMKCNAL